MENVFFLTGVNSPFDGVAFSCKFIYLWSLCQVFVAAELSQNKLCLWQ